MLIALLACSAVAVALAASAAAARTVATATTTDFRVVLTASKGKPAGGAPTAAVRIQLYGRSGHGWRPTASRRVPGTYFWNTVTGGHAVCRLDLRTAGEARNFRPVALVQLLVTPALGCGRALSYPLPSAP
jgi:hypothetical protein